MIVGSVVGNILNLAFNPNKQMKTIVSDLTYVRVHHTLHYICLIIDLYNREIIVTVLDPINWHPL
ncbi:hypothetical protein GI584_09740 [Gracilibacillus salitolerans]|uniref:Transposase n=1 Tax=Gracilibacillus salitolerans TaxID=2663022 RepID=A0A5Q2THS0_9BACI|nr:hypothetical protein GI584_09740 [Gracilibacillus salitolerans]